MVSPTETPNADRPPDRPDDLAEIDERPQRRREWAGGLRSVVAPLLLVAAIVAAVWYLERGREAGVTDEAGIGVVALPADKNSTGKPPAVAVGRAAPDFLLRTLDGGTVRLSDLRGGPVLITFWATWRQPSREELPAIVRAAGATPGLRVVAVNLQEAEGPVAEFAQQFGMTFPVAFDRTGSVARAYGVRELPASIFVDANGLVRTVKYGPMTGDYLREQLATLLPTR